MLWKAFRENAKRDLGGYALAVGRETYPMVVVQYAKRI